MERVQREKDMDALLLQVNVVCGRAANAQIHTNLLAPAAQHFELP